MAQLLVRNLDEALVRALKVRAARHGKSVEAEHRDLLQAALLSDVEALSLKQFLLEMPQVGPDDAFEFRRDLPRDVDE